VSVDQQLALGRRTRAAALGFGVLALIALGALLVMALSPPTLRGDRVQAPAPTPAPQAARPDQARQTPTRLFGTRSFWNRNVSGEPVDPNSTVLVQALAKEAARERRSGAGPWIATTSSSTPLYRVGPNQPRVRVRLDAEGTPGEKALQRAFAAVPIPRDARPATGQDRHMTIWQPSTDRLWEFWQARRKRGRWHARWGGAIRNVSKSPGYYTPAAWPGAGYNWGATASSLPKIGGTITVDELRRGRIHHALALDLPEPRAGTFSWPAQRTDGTGPATALPEGARLRLDPDVDVDRLRLTSEGKMIARAAQRYGMVVRDQTHKGISLFAEDPRGQADPYGKLFRVKTPLELLRHFPWDRLQVLKLHLCAKAPCRRG
jgi:hypothetical protein